MSEETKMSGLVAAIVNEREIVINLGESAGVKIGMEFRVLDIPRTVIDPQTGKDLGIIEREKIRVRVAEVRALLSIARTYETYRVNEGGTGISWGSMILPEPPKLVTRVKTLRYEDSGLGDQPFDEKSSFVKVGDHVEAVEEQSAARHEEGEQHLEIIEAIYGTKNKQLDVKGKLQALSGGKKLSIVACNEIAGDPEHHVIKTLKVRFKYGDKERTRMYKEKDRVELP